MYVVVKMGPSVAYYYDAVVGAIHLVELLNGDCNLPVM